MYYIISLLVPSIMFSVLTLISLTLQPGSSDRISLGLYIVTSFRSLVTADYIWLLPDENSLYGEQSGSCPVFCSFCLISLYFQL